MKKLDLKQHMTRYAPINQENIIMQNKHKKQKSQEGKFCTTSSLETDMAYSRCLGGPTEAGTDS